MLSPNSPPSSVSNHTPNGSNGGSSSAVSNSGFYGGGLSHVDLNGGSAGSGRGANKQSHLRAYLIPLFFLALGSGSGSNGGDIPNDPGKMFIGGLSWQTTPESIREYFSIFGELAEVMVMKDPATRYQMAFLKERVDNCKVFSLPLGDLADLASSPLVILGPWRRC